MYTRTHAHMHVSHMPKTVPQYDIPYSANHIHAHAHEHMHTCMFHTCPKQYLNLTSSWHQIQHATTKHMTHTHTHDTHMPTHTHT